MIPIALGAALAATLAQGQGALPATQTPTLPPVPPGTPPPRVKDSQAPPPIVPPTNASGPLPNAPLTANEAARIALRTQPNIASAQGAVVSAQGRTRETQALQNPTLSAGAGYNGVRSLSGDSPNVALQAPTGTTSPGVSPAYPYSTALGIRQLLFDFNQTRNLVRQNRALTEVAIANLSRTQQNVVNSVENAFYTEVNAKRLVDVAEQNLANRQRQLDLANARLRNDIGVPVDVVTAETSKSQAVLNLQTARDTELQARYTLLLAIGVDPMTPVNVGSSDEPTFPTTDPKALVNRGLERRPEVRAAFSTVAASKYGLSAAKALNLPSIYLTAAAGTVGGNLGDSRGVASIGLGLQFPLFDGGQRKGAIQAANGQVASALADLNSATLLVRNDVTSAYVALLSAESRIPTADEEVANAREGVRIAEGRYAAGLGLFQDITTAQAQLLTALQDRTVVQSNVNLARVRLRYATGEIGLTSATPPPPLPPIVP